jgi:hypothetical protein
MERDVGTRDGRAGMQGTRGGTDALILAAAPGADPVIQTTAYNSGHADWLPGTSAMERPALYLLRLLTGVLAGGGVMLATIRWTHLDASVVRDMFFGILMGLMTLVAAASGFYYGAVGRPHRAQLPDD